MEIQIKAEFSESKGCLPEAHYKVLAKYFRTNINIYIIKNDVGRLVGVKQTECDSNFIDQFASEI